MSGEHTSEGLLPEPSPSVSQADWSLLFKQANNACPALERIMGLSAVSVNEICTGKMQGVWQAVENQNIPMIHCAPVTRNFVLRVMAFMGTWHRANSSGMVTSHKPEEKNRISARRLAAVMREPEGQVAYALRLLAIDEAVWMTQVNGKTEFRFNKTFV